MKKRPPTNEQHCNLLKNLQATVERIERLEKERDEARRQAEILRDEWADERGSDPESRRLPWENACRVAPDPEQP